MLGFGVGLIVNGFKFLYRFKNLYNFKFVFKEIVNSVFLDIKVFFL